MTGNLSPQTEAMVRRALARYAPPVDRSLTEWAESERFLASGTKRPGPYRVALTPYLRLVQEEVTHALTGRAPTPQLSPRPAEVGVQKAAQMGYTEGVLMSAIGYVCDCLRMPQMVLFAKDSAAREFASEKLEPTIESTPALARVIEVKSRARGETALHRSYPGGFCKLVGSRSPSNVKSSPLPFVAVEEPDDTERDLRGQGDSIDLARERVKSYSPDSCILVGGTPTIRGLSIVEATVAASDQRHYHVPCHECGHAAPLAWEHVTWQSDESVTDPVYGQALPDTAAYACPGCGVLWTDAERVRNVARADEMQRAGEPGVGCVAHAPFDGRAGFYLNELLSSFEGSRLPALVRKYLRARHEYEQGRHEKLISFYNNTLGLPYEMQSDAPSEERLAERAEPYAPGTVPHGAVVVTAGVDVQHDRLHVNRWAWGRGEEAWLVGRHVIPGDCTDKRDPVWDALDELLAAPLTHATGARVYIAAASVDSGDGQTAEPVYAFCRRWRRRRQPNGAVVKVMAIKGASTPNREIFSTPRAVDHTRAEKVAKRGLQVYLVGVDRAKDTLAAALKLQGHGPGRLHWYEDVEPEFYAQITAEVKFPERGKLVWRKKAGQANEDLDCHNYARHAARSLRLHVWTERQWQTAEHALRQRGLDLVEQAEAPAAEHDTPPTQTPPPAARPAPRRPRRGGWVGGWRG